MYIYIYPTLHMEAPYIYSIASELLSTKVNSNGDDDYNKQYDDH